MKSNSFQFETITCSSVVCRTVSVIIYSTTKFHMRNKQQETILHTTNREYHHQLILSLIVHFHTTMKSQKFTGKDSNSSNKEAAAAVSLIIFRLESLQKYIILFSLYPHLCAHYVHTHFVWKWGHLCWINECDPYLSRSRGYHNIVVNCCDSRPGAPGSTLQPICVCRINCFVLDEVVWSQKNIQWWTAIKWHKKRQTFDIFCGETQFCQLKKHGEIFILL